MVQGTHAADGESRRVRRLRGSLQTGDPDSKGWRDVDGPMHCMSVETIGGPFKRGIVKIVKARFEGSLIPRAEGVALK